LLKDKVVIVTGGSGLIGNAFVQAVLDNNGIPIIADVLKPSVNNVEYINLNICSKESIENCIKIISEKYGKIDAWINNAYPRNKNYGRQFFDVEYEDFCENLNLHAGGYFLCSQAISKYFIEQGYGNIINMASIYGNIAPRFEIYNNTSMSNPVEYAVIKSGIIHLTRYIAKYLKGKNIRVNSVSPGGILDNQPQNFLNEYNKLCLNKGMLDKEDLTGTLIFLLSDSSKYINGQNIIVDDGFTL